MQYHAISCNTMQYHAIPCNTMQYHAIPCNIMQYHAIPCFINICWRSIPLTFHIWGISSDMWKQKMDENMNHNFCKPRKICMQKSRKKHRSFHALTLRQVSLWGMFGCCALRRRKISLEPSVTGTLSKMQVDCSLNVWFGLFFGHIVWSGPYQDKTWL